MIAALAAGLAAAVVLLLGAAWMVRRRAVDARREHERAEEHAARMRASVEALRQAEALAAEADNRAADLERQLEAAEQRAIEAEMRASEAEQQQVDSGSAAGQTLLFLEKIRVEREWTDVVGPGVAPPAVWDGSLEAALNTELAIIRETMGAPGELLRDSPFSSLDDLQTVVSMRLSTELLRLLARDGGEMRVDFRPGEVTVRQEAPEGTPAGFEQLVEAAARSGVELSISEEEGWITARLKFPQAGQLDEP
jgi:hypothetical protein